MAELILTILFSTLIIVTFRIMGQLKISELQVITFNYFFALLYGFLIWQEPFSIGALVSKSWFYWALLTGLVFIITFFLMSRSARKTGVAITAVASRMSVLIPVLAGFILFNDRVSIIKVIGILLALLSFYMIFKPKGAFKIDARYFLLPFFLFLGIGTNDTIMKYIQFHFLQGDETLFLTAVFAMSFVLGTIYLTYSFIEGGEKLELKNVLAGFVLGSLNFGSTYFFMLAMKHFEATLFFPVVNVSIVIASAIVGLAFFNERFSKINWAGIFIAIIAILIISMA